MHCCFFIVALYRRQQTRRVFDWEMSFEICGLIRDQSVAICMALVECIVSESTNDVKQFLAKRTAVSGLLAPINKGTLFSCHGSWIFFTAGFAQVVCLGKRIARKLLCNTHHALLVHHEAIRVMKHFSGIFMEVLGLFDVVLDFRVGGVHFRAHRTWAIQSNHSANIFKRSRAH